MMKNTEYLSPGDATLTRRVKRLAEKRGLTVEEDRVWKKRYGRFQTLGYRVPARLIDEARQLCDADKEDRAEKKRKRQERDTTLFADQIRDQFPSCPDDEVLEIADHATEIGSGRVGRSQTCDDPIFLAVQAHIRHVHTDYDEICDENYRAFGDPDRIEARNQVRDRIDDILNTQTVSR